MARPARYTDDDILDGAATALAEIGPGVTIADVARAIEGPSGSIYHRFSSREELFARLWLRSISRFHVGLLAAYAQPDPRDALLAAARHVPRYCREHPAEARAMLLYSQRRLLESGPLTVRDQVERINVEVERAARQLVRRRYGSVSRRRLEIFAMATQQAPYAMVRPYIGASMPAWLDEAVVAAARAIAALADPSQQAGPSEQASDARRRP